MTRGELIVACLKLMYENEGELDSKIISSNADYEDSIANILPSIHRALNRIATSEKLPRMFKEISPINESNEVKHNMEINLYEEMPYLYRIVRVSLLTEKEVIHDLDFDIVGNKLILPYLHNSNNSNYFYQLNPYIIEPKEIKYIIEYAPYSSIRLESMEDTDEIKDANGVKLLDNICEIIPYYVKGDVYEETEPEIALMHMNKFESYLNEIHTPNYSQKKVKSKFKFE